MIVEDMASLWSYQEGMDELRQKLVYTNLELETANENMKQLFQHLKLALQERDEARDQLQKLLLLTKLTPPAEFLTPPPGPPHFQPTKANSSITESNCSLSDTYGSSPVDSLFDPVSSSPELPSSNKPFVPEMPTFDQGSSNCLVVENFVKGKVLPEKGKLLQAVLGAGPLLQTLLVAGGPLPRWRNPPPFQAFHIPPVSVNGCGSELLLNCKPLGNLSYVPKSSVNSLSPPFGDIPSQMFTATSMLNFASTVGFVPPGKRQRFL